MKARLFSFIFISLLIQSIASAQGNWEKIDLGSNAFLRTVSFPDSLHGWIAGDSGVIYHTSNGGVSWDQQETHIQNEIISIFFLDENRGWASAFNYTKEPYGTILLSTQNGGLNWDTSHYPTPNIFITCILYFDSLTGWMGGRPHAIVKTVDGGMTWHQAVVEPSTLSNFPVLGITFYNQNYGYACGGMFDIAGVVWSTTDGGDTWKAIDPSYAPADEVHAIHTFDSIHVIGGGGDPDFGYGVGMIKSDNGGESWRYDELGLQGYAIDLAFRTNKEGWAPIALQPKFVFTLDGGTTWSELATPDSVVLNDVIFPDSLHGYAVGKEGAFIKYTPKLIGGVFDHPTNSSGITLHTPKPNPFAISTTLSYSISEKFTQHTRSNLFIRIVDIYGKQIDLLGSNSSEPGYHECIWNPAELSNGLYLFELGYVEKGAFQRLTLPEKIIMLR